MEEHQSDIQDADHDSKPRSGAFAYKEESDSIEESSSGVF
jgi:hypothetical protein